MFDVIVITAANEAQAAGYREQVAWRRARKFPDCRIWSTSVTAESGMTKEDLAGRDLWAEKRNWAFVNRQSDDEPFGQF